MMMVVVPTTTMAVLVAHYMRVFTGRVWCAGAAVHTVPDRATGCLIAPLCADFYTNAPSKH